MQPRPDFGCDLAAATPTFIKQQIRYFILVLISNLTPFPQFIGAWRVSLRRFLVLALTFKTGCPS